MSVCVLEVPINCCCSCVCGGGCLFTGLPRDAIERRREGSVDRSVRCGWFKPAVVWVKFEADQTDVKGKRLVALAVIVSSGGIFQ